MNRRSAATPNHFAAACLRQNPLVPCGAVFFISRENLQTGDRPAILHTRTLKVLSAVWIWIPRHDPAQYAGEPDNAAATQGQERRFGASGDHKQETLLLQLVLPALETEIRFESCIFILDGKSDKQVSTCGHNFKI